VEHGGIPIGKIRDGPRTRERILGAIKARPGQNKSQLCGELGLGWGTVSHHLKILCKSHLVNTHRQGRTVRLFPTGLSPKHVLWLSALEDHRAVAIMMSLRQDPSLRIDDLADRLGFSRKTVRKYMALLHQDDLVTPQRDWPHNYSLRDSAFPPGWRLP